MTVYVQRDVSNKILGVYANAQPGYATEALADDDAQVLTYYSVHTPNIVAFPTFIGRWLDAEYALLMQKRAAAISAGTNIALVKQWDQAMSAGQVDLNSAAAQNFKAAVVSAGILTQPRADVIFS